MQLGDDPDDGNEFASCMAQETLILAAQELIAQALDREGYTYTDFSKLIGKPVRQIRRWMSGEDDLTLRALAEMLHALDCAPVGLTGGTTNREGAKA